MRTSFDSEAMAGYVAFSDRKVTRFIPVGDKVICDLSQDGLPVGFEFIGVTQRQFDALARAMAVRELV